MGLLSRFRRAESGQVVLIFALSTPVIIGGLAGSIDVTTWYYARTRLQQAADGAALATAREFQIATVNQTLATRTAENYVRGILKPNGPEPSNITVKASAALASSGAYVPVTRLATYNTVQVDVTAVVSPIFSRFFSDALATVSATATARLNAGPPICLIGLDPKSAGTLHFEKNAKLTADGCAVYANSSSRGGLQADSGALTRATSICTVGGYSGSNANYNPLPTTDCPPMVDPLASRTPPSYGSCLATNKRLDKATATLQPGVYCGGLQVTNKASVTLAPGTYIVKDGTLSVDKHSSLQGQNISLYFVGDKAGLLFDKDSTISLTAPNSGSMAGILMSEDRATGAPITLPIPPDLSAFYGGTVPSVPTLPAGAPKMREYRIVSDNARMLLGTIYLPAGRLMIDSSKPVADQSAFTVIVAMRLDLFDGPNLYLNTGYSATNIPVPAGVGPVSGTVQLTR